MTNTKPPFQDVRSGQVLEARARIDAFNADYANAIDSDRLEEWPQFFTADGIYRVTTRENYEQGMQIALIYARGAGMLADRITALRTANIFEPHVYCHQFGAVKVIGSLAGRGWPELGLKVECNFTVVRTMATGAMTMFAAGRTYDTFVEGADGGLRLAERVCVLDSRQIDTLLVIPL